MASTSLSLTASILENIGECFLILDSDWNYTYVNRNACELLNIQEEYLLGKNIYDVYPDYANTETENAFKDAMLSRKEKTFTIFNQHSKKWLELRAKGIEAGLIVFFKDVSEQKLAFEKTKTSEAYFKAIFNQASEAIILFNSTGEIIEYNKYAESLFGYSQAEIIGKKTDHILLFNVLEIANESELQPTRNESKNQKQLYAKNKAGLTFPIEISLGQLYKNLEDDQITTMAFVFDITSEIKKEAELRTIQNEIDKRAEKKLKESQNIFLKIFQMNPIATFIIDAKTFHLMDANHSFEKLFEIKKANYVGKNISELFFLQDLDLESKINKRSTHIGVSITEEITIKIPNGKTKHLIVSLDFMHFNDLISLMAIAYDITDRKHAEVATAVALEKQKELNTLKSKFISTASHEFRTPLSTILSSISLLEKYNLSEKENKSEKHFIRIKNSVQHLTSLLNDFLSLEKLDENKVNLTYTQIDLKVFFEEIIDDLRGITLPKAQQIQLNSSGPEIFTTDTKILRNILFNLLSNASKYSPNNSVIILDSVFNGTILSISIIDQGIGIPKSDQHHIFSRFYRASNATETEGTGLGLNIVKNYAELLGGSVSFESTENNGSVFKVEISPPNSNES